MLTHKKLLHVLLIGFLYTATPLSAETKATTAQPYQQFEDQIRATVTPLAGKEIVGLKVLNLSADIGPWLDTGLSLKPGDKVTMLVDGKMWLSRALNLSFNAPFATWARISSKGPIFRGARNTNTFTVSNSGNLQLKLHPGVRWLDTTGNYLGDPAAVNPDAGGGVNVAIIQWSPTADVSKELKRLADTAPSATWTAAELDRQLNQKTPPNGWKNIWEGDTSEIFTEVEVPTAQNAPSKAIELNMHDDAAIIEKETPLDLTPQTTLSWKWKAVKLPSQASENSLPTHDYMSIAVKFDNGRDLTFFWSKDLPVDTTFHCPLPGWAHRETHVVARSGTADLNKWLSEDKNILEYYKKAIGGPLPKKITHVWLIGVSFLQHVDGVSQFGDIELKDGNTKIHVY